MQERAAPSSLGHARLVFFLSALACGYHARLARIGNSVRCPGRPGVEGNVIEKFSTGIEGLDQLTDGGFLRGSAYIIQGPPGAGKTILANQFCYAHVRAGGRALYMTLLAESSSRMLAYVSQMDFFEGSALPDAMQYISG